jgi:hypothetical protein
MRLMERGIEMAQAEREINRVDVFQRWREKREMRGEVDDRDDRRPLQAGRRISPSFKLPIR